MKPTRPKYVLEFFYTSFPERDKAEWYKWEFLRRNKQYRADYKKFEDSFGAWLRRKGYWYEYNKRPKWSPSDEKYFYTAIAPVIVRLCVKWGVGDLHPPQRKFKKIRQGEFREDRPSGPATGFRPELNWDFRLIKELWGMGFTGTGGNARRYGHLVLLEFDLIWPKRDLLHFAKRVLVRAQENYRDELREQGMRFPMGRHRFEDYDTHLRIWDLEHSGKTVKEISRMVFPSDHADSVLQKVRDHLKSAKRFISGSYKEIR